MVRFVGQTENGMLKLPLGDFSARLAIRQLPVN